MRDIIIGDIHGCYEELILLLKEVGYTKNDRIISVGDIVDRGPDSLKVYEFFKGNPQHVVVMGNHENKHVNQVLSYSQEIVKLQFGDRYSEFLKWAKDLPCYFETDSAIIVHASLEPDVALEEQRKEVLIGSTSGEKYLTNKYGLEDWTNLYKTQKPILFGHRVVGDIVQKYGDNIYGIETGACFGGYLSAITLPDFKIFSIKSPKNYWKFEMEKWQVAVLRSKPWRKYEFEKIRREISKVKNSKQAEVSGFISGVENWFQSLEAIYTSIKEILEYKAFQILEKFEPDSAIQAAKEYEYSIFLILAMKNRLTVKNLEDSLRTPEKVFRLARQLDLNAEDPF
ncbi:serine/threonine protein phosphatase [Leptospira yasudae]|uniref:metallophosphoesterase n=1 Tax=Leptospira yasudae TaxID=2202201 RepID=UPI000E59C069|nr:metallophosphoesterase [Leptospira yasudae]RHX94817.1 serine/threonine protein phosphatase [Leptospira yasudae]